MQEHELPTWPEIARHARTELDAGRTRLSDAGDWLRSDWRPLGSPLSPGVGDSRAEVMRLIGEAKGLIDQAKGLLDMGLRDG